MVQVKIVYEGIELFVPIGEVGAVMRQLREAKPPAASTSAERVTAKAAPAETNRKQQDMLPGLADPSPTIPINPSAAWPMPPAKQVAPAKVSARLRDVNHALSFLQAIRNFASKNTKLYGDGMAVALGVVHPRGIGSRAAIINKLLGELGFRHDQVYEVPRDSSGAKHWIPGPRLNAAIEALNKEAETKQ